MSDNDTPKLGRRQVLRTIGAGTAVGVGGVGAFTGTVAAWDRFDVDFKGCSEVWLVVGADDIAYDPPTVVRVVFALPDGSTACRAVEFTPENTTRIPGQYGDAPVRKVTASDGEKVLGVIFYNYRSQDRFSSASCIHTNEHRCAMTPGTPSVEDADCVQEARTIGGYDCSTTQSNPGRGRGERGRDENDAERDSDEGDDERDRDENDDRDRRGRGGQGRGRGFGKPRSDSISDFFDRLFGR